MSDANEVLRYLDHENLRTWWRYMVFRIKGPGAVHYVHRARMYSTGSDPIKEFNPPFVSERYLGKGSRLYRANLVNRWRYFRTDFVQFYRAISVPTSCGIHIYNRALILSIYRYIALLNKIM